jgi:hypothetical protein
MFSSKGEYNMMKKFPKHLLIVALIAVFVVLALGSMGSSPSSGGGGGYSGGGGGGSSDGGTQYTATFVNNSSVTVEVRLAWGGGSFSLSPGSSQTARSNAITSFTDGTYIPEDRVRIVQEAGPPNLRYVFYNK